MVKNLENARIFRRTGPLHHNAQFEIRSLDWKYLKKSTKSQVDQNFERRALRNTANLALVHTLLGILVNTNIKSGVTNR